MLLVTGRLLRNRLPALADVHCLGELCDLRELSDDRKQELAVYPEPVLEGDLALAPADAVDPELLVFVGAQRELAVCPAWVAEEQLVLVAVCAVCGYLECPYWTGLA